MGANNKEDYLIIKNSNLFDEVWFKECYSLDDQTDSIDYYLSHGVEMGLNPTHFFDTLWYLEKYPDVNDANINPFVHYIKYGLNEGRFTNKFTYYTQNKVNKNDINANRSIIEDSNFFDKDFYVKLNKDVSSANVDPLDHYIRHGVYEYRKPNHLFSNKFYEENYLDDKEWNQLTHYAVLGQFKGNKVNILDFIYSNYSNVQIDKILNALENKVAIIVLVFNLGISELTNCINTIKKSTDIENNIFIINYTNHNIEIDYGDDVFIFDYYSNEFNLLVRENIIFSSSDAVFLNSYSEVTYHWLEKLIIKAYSNEDISMVTPISNNIANISPETYNLNHESTILTNDGVSKLLEKTSINLDLNLSHCQGPCFYIKHDLLFSFDFNINSWFFGDDVFGRIIEDEVINVVDDSTFIYQNPEFFVDNQNRFNKPDLLVEHFNFRKLLSKNNLIKLENEINSLIKYISPNLLKNRILIIVEDDSNLEFFNDFLLEYNKKSFDFYFLTLKKNALILWQSINDKVLKLNKWNINCNYEINLLENFYFNILYSLKIDIVHCYNIKYPPLDLIKIINLLNIPLIFQDSNLLNSNSCNDVDYIFEKSNINGFMNSISYYVTNNDNVFEHVTSSDLEAKILYSPNIVFLNEFNLRCIDFSQRTNIKILIVGNSDDLKHDDLFNNYSNEFQNNFECHFLEDFYDECFSFDVFHLESFNKIIDELHPDYIVMLSFVKYILDIMDISQNKKIPILINNNPYLNEFMKEFNCINLINSNCSLKDLKDCKTYYKFIKEFYIHDSQIKHEILYLSKFYEDMYLNLGNNHRKILLIPKTSSSTKENEPISNNFNEFLINSYFSPMVNAKFRDNEKKCFSLMEDVSRKLINNVDNFGEEPLVSIIMPVYNRKNIVLSSIKSVLKQTYENFELIIVDDGSDDGTKEVLTKLDDDRILLIFHKNNKGSSAARNSGLDVARGQYVAYLDSDNEWDLNYLKAMMGAFIELPDADAIYSGQLLYLDRNSGPIAVRYGSYNKSLLKNRNYIDINCFCHKLKILNEIGGFDENLKRLVDWDFILKISRNYKIFSVPILLSKYYYYASDNRITFMEGNSSIQANLIQEKNNDLIKNNHHYLNYPVTVIIPYPNSLINLRKSVNKLLSFNLENIEIFVVTNIFKTSKSIQFYLNQLNDDKIKIIQNNMDNYGFINQCINSSNLESDVLILDNNAVLSEGSIESMQYHAYSIPNIGIITPQQIISNDSSILKHVPYALQNYECDVTPSLYLNNVINIPLFFDGEYLKLNFAPFFCYYLPKNVLNSIDLDNLSVDWEQELCNYILNVLKLKIIHVSDALVYNNFNYFLR